MIVFVKDTLYLNTAIFNFATTLMFKMSDAG